MGGRGANSSINKKLSFLQYSKLHNKQVKSNNDLKALINYNNNKIKILEKEIKETNNNNRHYEIDRLKEENKTYNDNLEKELKRNENKLTKLKNGSLKLKGDQEIAIRRTEKLINDIKVGIKVKKELGIK